MELEDFITAWPNASGDCREIFTELKDYLLKFEGVELEFLARPPVTYSLRAARPGQSRRPLFVMVDVIEDQPRWLSVCFYGAAVTDPEGLGDYVPGGLLGEDGICFDIDIPDARKFAYIKERIVEAHAEAMAEEPARRQ